MTVVEISPSDKEEAPSRRVLSNVSQRPKWEGFSQAVSFLDLDVISERDTSWEGVIKPRENET